jgi:hypothetical protein
MAQWDGDQDHVPRGQTDVRHLAAFTSVHSHSVNQTLVSLIKKFKVRGHFLKLKIYQRKVEQRE